MVIRLLTNRLILGLTKTNHLVSRRKTNWPRCPCRNKTVCSKFWAKSPR